MESEVMASMVRFLRTVKFATVLSLMLFFAFFLTVAPSSAQLPTGTILGVAKDASGAVVPDATVTIRNTDTGQVRTVTTGPDGEFRAPALAVGHYEVKAEHAGFQTDTHTGLVLEVSQEAVVNFTFQVGSMEQQVAVSGEAPLVNTTSSSLGGLVNEAKIADLPLNGRNYLDLTLMQAGVNRQAGQGTSGGSAGTWFSSNGASPHANYFMLDGAALGNLYGGSSSSQAGTTLGVDGIKEYKVITNSFSAEYGMVSGSQMVMVSKGGTNRFHGDVFDYLRNSVMDARNFFDSGYLNGGPRLPELQRNNFGGSFGGPIRKNKTFFNAVYEGLRQNTGLTTVDNVLPKNCYTGSQQLILANNPCAVNTLNPTGTVPRVIQPLVALYPYPNLGNNQFTYPFTNTEGVNWAQIRIDQNFTDSDTLFGRYTIDKSNQLLAGTGNNAAGAPAYPQFEEAVTGQNQFLTLSENHIFSPTLLNTARLSFSRTNGFLANVYPGGVSSVTGPQISLVPGMPVGALTVGGLALFGPNTSNPTTLIQNVYTLSDDLFYTRNKHALKFGVLINRFNDGLSSPSQNTGSATFASVATLLSGIPTTYTELTPGSDVNRDFIYNTLGFYVQDDWHVASRLTLNLGLRYEFHTTPWELSGKGYAFRNFSTDTAPTQGPILRNASLKSFSPRLGFAWDVTGKGKTSIRGGFGDYFDDGLLGALFLQQSLGTPPLTTKSIHNNTANQLIQVPLAFTAADSSKSLHIVDYNSSQPHALEYNLTVEQQLPGDVALSVSYVGLRGLALFAVKEGNPTIPTFIGPGNVEYWAPGAPRVNPNWQTVTDSATVADSWYNSLQIVVAKRIGHGLEFQGSYTWARDLDTDEAESQGNDCNAPGSDIGVDPLFPQHEKGPACFDVTNSMHLNLLYHFPNIKTNNFGAKLLHGWWMGNIVSVQSGYPFSPELGTNRSQSSVFGGSNNDRPNVGASNATVVIKGTTYNFVPFDKNTVITGNPNQWFNPLMFALQPMAPCPNAPSLTCGTLGDSSRGLLRGPGIGEWDFSLVKDTPMPFLGEGGNLEFRAEFFNILNRANFSTPSVGTVFPGTISDVGPYSEAPTATAGQITSTTTTSRQIQLALKLIF